MLKLYNTLSRKKEPFKPLKKGHASIYACGPTVYDAAHIGNLRTYVFEDTLRRWLRHGHSFQVNQVMNITDVEDKIIAASKAKTPAALAAFTKPHEDRFFADLAALGIERVESYPKATDYVPQMIKLIQRILKAGFAYEREGSVYFDLAGYHKERGYGKLLNIDAKGFAAGSRIDADEYDKRDPQDFALWKLEPPGHPGWDSPWGHGRPGWHVECSAMVAAELGDTIDIHAGGVDLIFPHHENEIAQSQAATGKPLARYWLHAEHLLADGKKMAKSAKNYYTLADVTAKGFAPGALRLLFLQAHYRSKLNFTWESLAAAAESHERIQSFYDRLARVPALDEESPPAVKKLLDKATKRLAAAMDDDLNTAEALAALFDLIRDGNVLIDQGKLDDNDLGAVLATLKTFNEVLGVVTLDLPKIPAAVTKLAAEREQARTAEDYTLADALRQKIARHGYLVEDTDAGPRIRPS